MFTATPGTTPTPDPAPDPERTEVLTIGEKDWHLALAHINRAVRRVHKILKNVPITYINEWTQCHSDMSDLHALEDTANYYDASTYLFTNPETFHDFCANLITMVPPVQELISIKKSHPRTVVELTIVYAPGTTRCSRIVDLHSTWNIQDPPNIDDEDDRTESTDSIDRIAPQLKIQVRSLEEKYVQMHNTLDDRIAKDLKSAIKDIAIDVEAKIDAAIKATATRTYASAQTNLLETHDTLQHSITEGTLTADRLTGDIKTATENIQNLRTQSANLAKIATQTQETAKKTFVETRKDMETARNDILDEVYDVTTKLRATIPTPATGPPQDRYSHPDDYIIQGKKHQLRTKHFQDDKTPIHCDSPDDLLSMYTYLTQVASQYGIGITPVMHLDKWVNPETSKPPTFPYAIKDFTQPDKYHRAYTHMSLAIATKLKTGVTFSPQFAAITLTVHPHATDGYKMLYHLMCMTHQKLQRTKFIRKTKPEFSGNIFDYLTKYQNWITYNQTRTHPHIYEDDEIADDIIDAIKSSQWAPNLKHGLDEVTTKLDRYKMDTTGYITFPQELKLEFIGRSILQYYLERNENPFANASPVPPVARPLGGPPARGRTQNYQRSYSNDRSRSQPRSQSRERQPPNDLISCTICGGQHRSTTHGCPHLIRQYHLNQYLAKTTSQDVQRTVRDAEGARSRSQSRDTNRSTSRDSSRGRPQNRN